MFVQNFFVSGLLILVFIICCSNAAKWDYDGDKGHEHWYEDYEACGHSAQSPIDLRANSTSYNDSLLSPNFTNYDLSSEMTYDIDNNGHSVSFWLINSTLGMSGAGLPGYWKLVQFHFHWGSEINRGSEHIVDGAAYPFEAHLIHYNSDKYDNLSHAFDKFNGLAVLGVFVQISSEKSSTFDKIIESFNDVKYAGNETSKKYMFPMQSLLPDKTNEYFRYLGSLTTPPCHESVTWTVFRQPITMSQSQMDAFRTKLYKTKAGEAEKKLVDNYRPVQPLNDRTVYRSFAEPRSFWRYDEGTNGPMEWKYQYPMCGWQNQSPVDIATTKVEDMQKVYRFQFKRFDEIRGWTLANTGRAVEMLLGDGVSISGGGLSGTYDVQKITLHWGKTDQRGSEHTIDGKAYSLEIQFIAVRRGPPGNPPKPHHGRAVFSVFAQIAEGSNNSAIHKMANSLNDIRYPGNKTGIGGIRLDELLPNDTSTFYRYNGSLTSPNCTEGVVWTVFTDTITIPAAQVSPFRKRLYSDIDHSAVLHWNYRPVQPLNGRTIYRGKASGMPMPTTTPSNANRKHGEYGNSVLVLLLAATFGLYWQP